MNDAIIEITHAIYRMDCTGNGTLKLHYNDSEAIVCSGYGTLSLGTTEASGKQISVASDMKLKYSHFNYLTGEWPTHYKVKVSESVRWCGIKHISDDIYKLPTIDFERKKRIEEEGKKWWDDRKHMHMAKRREITTIIKPLIDIIEDEQIKSVLQEYFLEDKGLFDIGDENAQLEATTAAIHNGVKIIYDHLGLPLDSDNVWRDTC